MKKWIIIIIFINTLLLIQSQNKAYPFIYIPGMFDNGDLLTSDSLLVTNLNHPGGYYDQHYFNESWSYDHSPLEVSSNIVGAKYNRLCVANVTGPYRTDISLWLMADRFFALMHGKAPRFKNYQLLTHYQGADFTGTLVQNGDTIQFKGLVEEIWAKYGKKVYYVYKQGKYQIILNPNQKIINQTKYYINPDGYFQHIDEIKFNLVVHSSGGVALRRYLQICEKEGISHHVNSIINLSVPQQGARLIYVLKDAFPTLINDTMNHFFDHQTTGKVTVEYQGKQVSFTYDELVQKTRASMIYGPSKSAHNFRKLIGNYILYCIPFDGKNNELGSDPSLWDLHPNHRLIQSLNRTPMPEEIAIYNYRVTTPYAPLFKTLSKYLNLGQNDGVVDFRDTSLDHLPNGKQLNVTDLIIEDANHIPFPYIKAIYELRDTVEINYPFLKILLKDRVSKEEGITIIQALMKAIMLEMGFDLEYFLKHEDFSVIDYYAENPVLIN